MINHKCLHHSYFSNMHWFLKKDNLDLHSVKSGFILIIRKYCNSFYKWTDSYIRNTQVWTLVMLSHHFQAENDNGNIFFFLFLVRTLCKDQHKTLRHINTNGSFSQQDCIFYKGHRSLSQELWVKKWEIKHKKKISHARIELLALKLFMGFKLNLWLKKYLRTWSQGVP